MLKSAVVLVTLVVLWSAASAQSVGQGSAKKTGSIKPSPPCFDNTNRYVNCGNGTVTDTVTGLIWLQQADCLGVSETWKAANEAATLLKDGDCNGTLTDNSSPGDWRLPTQTEWSATIAQAVKLGCTFGGSGTAPSLTNDAGTGCYTSQSSFTGNAPGVAPGVYWSSTAYETIPSAAVYANLGDGNLGVIAKQLPIRVWPVRGGRR